MSFLQMFTENIKGYAKMKSRTVSVLVFSKEIVFTVVAPLKDLLQVYINGYGGGHLCASVNFLLN